MYHVPVLTKEAVGYLMGDKNGCYVDGTLGGGGHAEAILQQLSKKGRLIGIDQDPEAIEFAKERLREFKKKFNIVQDNFGNLKIILKKVGVEKVNGILLDLGISSYQIDTPERGFSYSFDGKLDMRMNTGQKLTAFEIVNEYPESKLAEIFKTLGEERRFRAVARAIVKARKLKAITTTFDLKNAITQVLPFQNRVKSLARVFQALRITVNDELANLKEALQTSLKFLAQGGRIVVISYHSLEDRIVKLFFKTESERCICPPELPICNCGRPGSLKILTKRPIRPSESEIDNNQRSRSAKLRAAERL